MKKKQARTNRRKTGGTGVKRPILLLLVIAVLIASAFLFLEWLNTRETPTTKEVSSIGERHTLPPRTDYELQEQQPYTSAVVHPRQATPPRKRGKTGHGSVAIIIDDMGSSLQEAKSLLAIGVPLTFSIIPGLPKVREVAESAHARGYQVMIHIPMEPKGYPQQRLEASGLLLSQNEDEIARRMNGYLKAIPYAAGANNHMGSRFTEDEGKMRIVLNQLKANALFFVDSRTTPRSVGLSLARAMNLDSAGRNVFLDNIQEDSAIRKQLDELADLARRRGSAIGICHPRKSTIQALAAYLPLMQKEGITFVTAGELVR
jgi:polysaccharide deacetylase 2 family uncharacterized protein YibQ